MTGRAVQGAPKDLVGLVTEGIQGGLKDVAEVAAPEDQIQDPILMEVGDVDIIEDVAPAVVRMNGIRISK